MMTLLNYPAASCGECTLFLIQSKGRPDGPIYHERSWYDEHTVLQGEKRMKHKDYYNDDYILDISRKIGSVIPDFDKEAFTHDLTGHLDDKELFPRFDCIVNAMERSMPGSYSENIEVSFRLLGPELEQPEGMFNRGWWLWPIGRYVERHGNED